MKKKISENEIRPKNLDTGKELALKKDLKRLLSHKNKFIEVNCPACDSNESNLIFVKYEFSFYKCNKCDTVYMNPRATPKILNEFYSNSILYDYWNKYIFPASQEVRKEKIFKPRVEKILEICNKYKIKTDNILEVGAGYGTFCEEIQKSKIFKKVIAVEPSASLAKSCRKIGVETIEDSIENINEFQHPPNVVVSFEVIEHLFSPKDFLHECSRIMASEGIIAITCPNFKGFDISILEKDSDSIDAEHINMFNPESLSLLFESCGFQVLECFTPGELDAEIVRNKILENKINVKNQPFLKTVLIDKWDELGENFQIFLQQNKLSSNMWIVGKKKK